MHDALAKVGVRLLLGFLSGLFSVGGSSIATPVLRLLGVPRLLALATPLPVALPTAVGAPSLTGGEGSSTCGRRSGRRPVASPAWLPEPP